MLRHDWPRAHGKRLPSLSRSRDDTHSRTPRADKPSRKIYRFTACTTQKTPSSPRPGSPPPCVWGAAKSYAPVIDQASVYAAPDRYLERSPLERRQIHSQIERSSSHGHRTMEDSPAQSLAALSGSAKHQPSPSEHRLVRPRCTWSCWGTLTARRYLLSPTRSRYRRQNGSVPKFLLMLFSSDFAVVRRSGTFGASTILA